MTGIGAGCTILIIFLTIQTCIIAKKVKRIRKYLDIKDTRREQEEDDQMWREKIEQGTKILRPNPTRNYAQMMVDKEIRTAWENRLDTHTDTNDQNIEVHRNWTDDYTQIIATRDQDQKEYETIPLLETGTIP